jgi:hypothetical protein
MAKKRRNIAFSLSFLDIMACGFGAVTLLFLILRHNANEIPTPDERLSSEISLLQQDIQQAEQDQTKALNSLDDIELRLVKTQGLSKRVITEIAEKEKSIQEDPNTIDILRRQIEQLEEETAQIEDIEFGDKVREFVGDGNRQYLTGLTLGGERVLILIDGSTSMLADTVVNALRRRNMDDDQKQKSAKWQWSLRTLEWLLAQLPPSSRFQVYVFNDQAQAMLADTEGEWLDASDSLTLERVMESTDVFVPSEGTSLSKAIDVIAEFDSKPDNLFILTDGLPTLGNTAPKQYMVTGSQRRQHFETAIAKLPRGIPVNIILFPMEGDPEAAALFWQLALDTKGAFIAPSRDWP